MSGNRAGSAWAAATTRSEGSGRVNPAGLDSRAMRIFPPLARDVSRLAEMVRDVLTGLRAEIWLIVREELKSQPHVRAFADFLAEDLRRALAEFA